MASKYRLRYIFKPLVKLIAKALIKIRVTPNIATIIMFIFSILSFVSLVYFQNLLFFSIFVFITGIFFRLFGRGQRFTKIGQGNGQAVVGSGQFTVAEVCGSTCG